MHLFAIDLLLILSRVEIGGSILICSVVEENIVSKVTYEYWLKWYKAGSFDVSDQKRSETPAKVLDEGLQKCLDANSFQTQKELSVPQQTIFNCLYAMGL